MDVVEDAVQLWVDEATCCPKTRAQAIVRADALYDLKEALRQPERIPLLSMLAAATGKSQREIVCGLAARIKAEDKRVRTHRAGAA